MSANERVRSIDLDETEFGTRLVSPDGARLELTDCGEDARGPFVWLVPVGEDGYRTGQRRRKLRQADAGAWVIDRQEDEVEISAAGQTPVSGTESSSFPLPRPEGDDPRFNFGLTYDVAKVLEAAGYPSASGVDFVGLQSALFRFLYSDETPAEVINAAKNAYEVPALNASFPYYLDGTLIQDEDQPLAARGHGQDDEQAVTR